MAIIRKKEIAGMNTDELRKKCGDLRLELLKANAQKSSKTAPRKVKEIKKTIARILTSENKLNKINREKNKKT